MNFNIGDCFRCVRGRFAEYYLLSGMVPGLVGLTRISGVVGLNTTTIEVGAEVKVEDIARSVSGYYISNLQLVKECENVTEFVETGIVQDVGDMMDEFTRNCWEVV